MDLNSPGVSQVRRGRIIPGQVGPWGRSTRTGKLGWDLEVVLERETRKGSGGWLGLSSFDKVGSMFPTDIRKIKVCW